MCFITAPFDTHAMIVFAWHRTDVKRLKGFVYITISDEAKHAEGANVKKWSLATYNWDEKDPILLEPGLILGDVPKRKQKRTIEFCGQIVRFAEITFGNAMRMLSRPKYTSLVKPGTWLYT